MNKKIKIVLSPFNPPLEVVDKIVVQIHAPYSDRNVTIQVCPNIQEYTENADAEGISEKLRKKIGAFAEGKQGVTLIWVSRSRCSLRSNPAFKRDCAKACSPLALR